jgi:Amt family ammonium transporter
MIAITPGSGYVPIYASYIIGLFSGIFTYFYVYLVSLKNKVKLDYYFEIFGIFGVIFNYNQ